MSRTDRRGFLIPTSPTSPQDAAGSAVNAAAEDAHDQSSAATAQSDASLGASDGISSEQRLEVVRASLDDDKAENILVVDLRGKSPMADFMVIASGRSARHVGAICEKLMDRMKETFGVRPRAEGVEHGDWALIDASDVIVHVFRPEVREFYALEKMWAPSQAGQASESSTAADPRRREVE